MTYLFFTPSSEFFSDNGQNWKRVKPGFYIGEYLQYAVDKAHDRQTGTPPFPTTWHEMDSRFFLLCLNGAYFSLLPPPYFSGALKNQGAKQTMVHLEREGVFAWDDIENVEQVDFMPGLNFSNRNGLGFSISKRESKVGFLETLMRVWDGSPLGGEGIIAGPAFNEKTLGWFACCHHPVQLPVAEIFFLANYNIRKLKFCHNCGKFHWEKSHIVCKDCRNKRERKRRAGKEKTPKEKFLNKVYQSLTRKGIKGGRQRKAVLKQINDNLAEGGLEAAERAFREILTDIKKEGKNNGRQGRT